MPDCNSCGHHTAEPVPFAAHESMKATLERTVKRLWIVILVLIVLLCATNAMWIYRENQFAEEIVTVEQESDENGTNNYIGHDGDISYGEAENHGENAET